MTIQFNRFTVAEYHSQRLSPVLRILQKNQVKDMPAKSIDNSMLGVSNEDVYNNKKNPEFSVGCKDEWKSTKMMVNVLL